MTVLIDEQQWNDMATALGIKSGFALSMAKIVAEGEVMATLYGVANLQKPKTGVKSKD